MTKLTILPEVKKQYEQYPYPARYAADERNRLVSPFLASLDAINHSIYRGRKDFNGFKALVSGGGTGDSTIWLAEQLRPYKDAAVIYLDMSFSSMKVAQERAEFRGLTNIKFFNGDILKVAELGMGPYDFIDCSGVLHHLADPAAGLHALEQVLKPDGGMNLMLYAPYGRAGVYCMQDMMRMINTGEESFEQKVANAKTALGSLPEHNIFNVMYKHACRFTDVDNDAGIYDLFLHTQDRAFTILQVHEWLAKSGLEIVTEPGTHYLQLDYLPETYIKDPDLLAKIKKRPLKIQQAIGEALSGRIPKHEMLVGRMGRGDTMASCADESLIPDYTINLLTPQQLAGLAAQLDWGQQGYLEREGQPDTRILFPSIKYAAGLLDLIDGNRSIGEILNGVEGPREETQAAFAAIFRDLHRGNYLYLRHPSVPPFKKVSELQLAMKGRP